MNKIVPLWGKWRDDKIGAFAVQAVIVDTGGELKFNSSFNELSYCESERPEPLQMSPVQAVCLCAFAISVSRASRRCCRTAAPHAEQLSAQFPPRDNRMMVSHTEERVLGPVTLSLLPSSQADVLSVALQAVFLSLLGNS